MRQLKKGKVKYKTEMKTRDKVRFKAIGKVRCGLNVVNIISYHNIFEN